MTDRLTALLKTTAGALGCASLTLTLFACDDSSGRRPDAWPGAAAAGDTDGDAADTDDAAPLDVQPQGLDEVFSAAGEEFDVPPEILKAIAWVETRWTMLDPHSEHFHDHGGPERSGLMGLSEERLAEGAALAGIAESTAASDPRANIRSAAAWLSARADEQELEERDNLSVWAAIVGDYPGFELEIARSGYVYDEIYKTLRTGFVAVSLGGDIQGELEPIEVWPSFEIPPPSPALQAGPDYSDAVWRASPNNSSRPGGSTGKPTLIIIHTCEGSYNGCWSWLSQSQSGVSAHYVVNADGSQVSQLVAESRKAWHIGAKYKCSRNGGMYCNFENVSSNNFTIGIEHAGSASQTHWDDGLLEASAKLVCDITRDQGISRDEFHIVGHGQLQPYNRVDPGSNWPWEEYLALVDAYCDANETPEPDPQPDPEPDPQPEPSPGSFQSIIVDSNNANNQDGVSMVAVSNSWVSANATPGHYGTGYWYAATSQSQDAATFWFYLEQASEHTIDAWWTAGTNRANNALFRMVDSDGNLIADTQVDQQAGGNGWAELGTYSFDAGWNAVQLSRRAQTGKVVIADAVRVR